MLLGSRLLARPGGDSPQVRLIDAHVHFAGDTAETLRVLEAMQLKLFNISVGRMRGTSRNLAETYRDLAREHPDHFGWCTGVDTPEPGDANYAGNIIRQLDRDFADGALACKFWKDFGLVARKADGSSLLIDDPLLEPVFSHMESIGKPALLHIAEPREAWEPLRPGSVYFNYYSKRPKEHFLGRTDVPSYETLMEARDHVIARHPRLTVVGAHLGSMESDVDALAERFDHYPNFFADTSGVSRALSLAEQDPSKVRAFFVKYQDRLVYGSDRSSRGVHSKTEPASRQTSLDELQQHITSARAFYGSMETVFLRDREVRGLGLPEDVMKRLFLENARAIYPGL